MWKDLFELIGTILLVFVLIVFGVIAVSVIFVIWCLFLIVATVLSIPLGILGVIVSLFTPKKV